VIVVPRNNNFFQRRKEGTIISLGGLKGGSTLFGFIQKLRGPLGEGMCSSEGWGSAGVTKKSVN